MAQPDRSTESSYFGAGGSYGASPHTCEWRDVWVNFEPVRRALAESSDPVPGRDAPDDAAGGGESGGNLEERVGAPASSHYSGLSPEPISVIEGWGLNYRTGNAIKYIARAGKKDPSKTAEDYRKAIAYLAREINILEGKPGW